MAPTNGLTDEQKRQIEAKRLKALQLRQAKQQAPSALANKSPWATSSTMGVSSTPPSRPSPPMVKNTNSPNNTVKRKAPSQYFAQPVTLVKISLDTHSRLNVQFPYKEALIKIIKGIKTSRFDTIGRKWTIDVSDYSNLLNAFKELGDSLKVDADSVPARIVSLIESHRKYRDVPVDLLEKFDKDFIDKLFPFQREGIIFGIQREGRCLIADDMGLGKTIQALGIVGWFRRDWPVLIACPASVTVAWKNAIVKWLARWVSEDEIELLDQKELSYHAKFFIGSYERLAKRADEMIRRKIPTLIFDECHNIKSDGAIRTQAAMKVSKVAKRTILISGTPALSRPIELYTQLAVLNDKLFTNKHDFGLRYCNAHIQFQKGVKQVWDYRGYSNTDELRILLESTVMIRRLKKDVLQDLPSKNRVVIDLPLKISEEERIELDKVKAKVSNRNFFHKENPDLMNWYRETARLKVTAVLDYLERKIAKHGKIICFAHHKTMVEAIADYLSKNKVKHIIITGETMTSLRQNLCDEFQNDPRTKIALISILAAGVGITLTAANLVIFTELSWNPGVLAQAEDRAHRIGQEENVTIEYLVSPDTCDEHLWTIIQRKLAVLGKVGLSKDQMKDSARRDANQSLIEDYFNKSGEIEDVKEQVDDKEPTATVVSNTGSAESLTTKTSTPVSSQSSCHEESQKTCSEKDDNDIVWLDTPIDWSDCIDID